MSSSSNNRPSSLVERRIANDNGASRPRLSSGQQGGSKAERDPRRPQSPQTSTSGSAHRRVPSTSQRTKSALEERRTERVQVTTRETLTSRTRSPERRSATQMQQQERVRPSEVSRTNSADHRPRLSRAESAQGRLRRSFITNCPDNIWSSPMESGSLVSTAHDSAPSISNIYTSACFAGAAIATTHTSLSIVLGGPRSCNFRRLAFRFHGLRGPIHSIRKDIQSQ